MKQLNSTDFVIKRDDNCANPWHIALPVILLALIALPVIHLHTLAEEDLIRMMNALIYGSVSNDSSMTDFRPYGITFSFGWYQLFQAITPEAWLRNPAQLALLINGFGVVSGFLCTVCCTLYLQALYGRNVAVISALLFFLSPVMLPVIFSGHPLIGAAACLFLAGWLLTFTEPQNGEGWAKWCYFLVALMLLTFGLSLRAEIVLAFPFVWIALKNPGDSWQSFWKYYSVRGLIFALAFLGFLLMQRGYLPPVEGSTFVLAAFIDEFLSLSKTVRGVIVLVLGLGVATLMSLSVALWRGGVERLEIYLFFALAIPALLLFLPNPQPARHFFFPVLAVCWLAGIAINRWQSSWLPSLGIALATVVLNQGLLEFAHPYIVARANYVQNYPSLTERRFTPSAPSGAFIPDQIATQINDEAERQEAIVLAKNAPDHLVILADHNNSMLGYLLAAYPDLRSDYGESNGIPFIRLQSATKTVVVMEKYQAWPKDITAEVLQDKAWQDWPVYVQPSTKSRYEQTEIPAARAFKLPDLVNSATFLREN